MSPLDANAANPRVLTIAHARFALSGLGDAAAFSASFQTFWCHDDSADLACDVLAAGPDEALAQAPPVTGAPWAFTVQDGRCELVRRNQAGDTLWRIAASQTFEHAAITWHPRLFPAVYGSYEQSWSTGLGLSLLVFRLLAHGGLVLHGTAAALDGRGILCLGVSGSGKSTLARLLDPAGAQVLSDERPVLRRWPGPAAEAAPTPGDTAFRVYGSPWPSSADIARNAWAPLARLYFLEHGAKDRLTPLSPRDAFNRLIHVATIPWHDPALFDPCLETVETLLQSVPCAVLAFRPTADVIDLLREDLRHHATTARP